MSRLDSFRKEQQKAAAAAPAAVPVAAYTAPQQQEFDPTSVSDQLAKLIWESNNPQARAPSVSVSPAGSPAGAGSAGSPRKLTRGGLDHAHRQRLLNFYGRYNPQKLPSVVSTLVQYRGHEDALFDALARKYGPEPPEGPETPLPAGWKQVESSRGDIFYKNIDGRKQWERPSAMAGA